MQNIVLISIFYIVCTLLTVWMKDGKWVPCKEDSVRGKRCAKIGAAVPYGQVWCAHGHEMWWGAWKGMLVDFFSFISWFESQLVRQQFLTNHLEMLCVNIVHCFFSTLFFFLISFYCLYSFFWSLIVICNFYLLPFNIFALFFPPTSVSHFYPLAFFSHRT